MHQSKIAGHGMTKMKMKRCLLDIDVTISRFDKVRTTQATRVKLVKG